MPAGDAGGGQLADLGVSDVFPSSCAGGTADPATVGDFWGPNQVMVFVTPKKVTAQLNISAEAAYFVMGQPETGKTVAPWTDATKLAVRNFKSGTQTMIGAAIRLDANAFKGTDSMSAGRRAKRGQCRSEHRSCTREGARHPFDRRSRQQPQHDEGLGLSGSRIRSALLARFEPHHVRQEVGSHR